MLLNNLYTIESSECSPAGDKITFEILLNKEHALFRGHFPGNPILPGVCTVQIIRELLEVQLGKAFRLVRAGNIKYLGFINPLTEALVRFELLIGHTGAGTTGCQATVSARGIVRCSFKGEYGEE